MTRQPPFDEQAERALIGAALLGAEATCLVASEIGVTRESFFLPSHREVWGAIDHLVSNGKSVDLMTVSGRLRERKTEAVIGRDLVISCMDDCTSPAYAQSYAQTVKDMERRRLVIQSSLVAIESAQDLGVDPAQVVSLAQEGILSVDVVSSRRTREQVKQEVIDRWTNAHNGVPMGLPFPIHSISSQWAGPENGLVTLLISRAGVGKSAMLGQWITFLAQRGMPIGVCPFEDGPPRFMARNASLLGKFSSFLADQGGLSDRELDSALASVDEAFALPIYWTDKRVTAGELTAWAVQAKARHGIKALFLDAFKDILTSGKSNEDDILLCSQITHLAERLDIPVIVTAHLRKTESDIITRRDIRGSSRIDDDAKLVCAIQEVTGEDGEPANRFDILKSNHGPLFHVPIVKKSCPLSFVDPDMEDVVAHAQHRKSEQGGLEL